MTINSMLQLLLIISLIMHFNSETIQLKPLSQALITNRIQGELTFQQFLILNKLVEEYPIFHKYNLASMTKQRKIDNVMSKAKESKIQDVNDGIQTNVNKTSQTSVTNKSNASNTTVANLGNITNASKTYEANVMNKTSTGKINEADVLNKTNPNKTAGKTDTNKTNANKIAEPNVLNKTNASKTAEVNPGNKTNTSKTAEINAGNKTNASKTSEANTGNKTNATKTVQANTGNKTNTTKTTEVKAVSKTHAVKAADNADVVVYQNYVIILQNVNKTIEIMAQSVSSKNLQQITFSNIFVENTPNLNPNNTNKSVLSSQQVTNAPKSQITHTNSMPANISPSYTNRIGQKKAFTAYKQENFVKTMLYLEKTYPHIKNYQIRQVMNQLVAGSVYEIYMSGFDQITQLYIRIHADIKLKFKVYDFEVDCLNETSNKLQNCTKQLAENIYKANTYILQKHPDIKTCMLNETNINFTTNENVQMTSIFINKQKSQKAIFDVSIQKNTFDILSFFIFPQ